MFSLLGRNLEMSRIARNTTHGDDDVVCPERSALGHDDIYLHDAEHGELEMAAVHGCTLHSKGSRLKVGKDGMVGFVAATGKMRYAPDVRLDPN